MMPYKKRYSLLMRLQDNAGLLAQAALLVFLIIAAYATYKPRSRPDMALNAAVDSCQARGYFDAGTVRVKCQVEE